MRRAYLSRCLFLLALCQLGGTGAVPAQDAGWYTPEIIAQPETTLLDTEDAGRLYRVGDHLLCVMEGTPAEMGFQHGRLLARHIRHIIKDGYTKKALWDEGYTHEYVMAQSERMERHFAPEYIEEMRGLVDGLRAAGVDDVTYEEVRLGVTQPEILHYEPNAPPGCSNFAVWGQWTPDGRLLHGRNLDWNVSGDAQDDAVILVWRPSGGIPFMMVGWAGGIGSVSGMNAKGITIGEMTLPSPNGTFDGLPLFLTMRRVLEKATNVEEAVAVIRDNPHTRGWNYIIGDGAAPDGRAMEVDARGADVYAPLDPKEGAETEHESLADAVRRTNHPVGKDRLLELALTLGPEHGINVKTWDELKLLFPFVKTINTFQRYDWLGQQIKAHPGAIDVTLALRLLANGPVFNDDTLHAWVFDPRAKTAYVANAGNNPPVTATRRPFTRIDLAEWF
ncbi:MAG TPA: C45 family autoproteolytic acyltransferase/hydrolase [Candidatus Hydrogenedentes bacterium]|nr:C45 family autoproteolytic acyltransferase/hydrolase [Candidatus Hydrogenedentota bacterium]HNT88422.1 C45 family autoproteolytic acyltransferase/hydrolase [Candidatus Hydrogenedentota bacterium]